MWQGKDDNNCQYANILNIVMKVPRMNKCSAGMSGVQHMGNPRKKRKLKRAGAELCHAQLELELTKPYKV